MSRETAVLYDAPGPRARRLTVIVSVVFTVLTIAGLYFFIYKPLDQQGQFSMVKWGPLIDPSNPYFTAVWERLRIGGIATLEAAGLGIVFSLIFGLVLAIFRLQLRSLATNRYARLPAPAGLAIRGITWLLNAVTRVCVEFFRGIPLIITIFFVWRLLGGGLGSLVVGLTIYNGIVIAEIIRSGMEGLPKGQREAAQAVGLSSLQTTRFVLLPQAIRIMLPALVSQIIVILKDTALGGVIIGYQEIIQVGRQLTQALPYETLNQESYNPIQIFAVIGVMFIIVNYALSKLAQYLEARMGRRTSGKLKMKSAGLTSAVTPGATP
jgi:glutamate transport system permease protein